MKQYPKYKDSGINWIGEIPERWIINKLKHISEDKKFSIVDGPFGTQLKAHEYKKEGIPLIRVSDLNFKGYLSTKYLVYISEEKADELRRSSIKKEDIIIAKTGATIGKCGLNNNIDFGIIASSCLKISPNNNKMNPQYLKYLITTIGFQQQLLNDAGGSTRDTINITPFSNLFICSPQIEDQEFIIKYLDKKTQQIDTLIEKKQKQTELLKEYRTAIINQAVTKGLNPNVKMRSSGIKWLGQIPEHWKVKRLKFITKINPTKSEISNNINSDEIVTFLPMENVSVNGVINNSNKKAIGELIKGFTYFCKNDVIVAKITPCFENGKGAFLNNLDSKIGFGSTEFHVLRALSNIIDPKYIYYITKSDIFMKLGEALMHGAAGQKRVPSEFIENFTIAIPNINKHIEIVKYIDNKISKIDIQINQNNEQIKQLKEYRTTLISDVVTGKIDVRDEVN